MAAAVSNEAWKRIVGEDNVVVIAPPSTRCCTPLGRFKMVAGSKSTCSVIVSMTNMCGGRPEPSSVYTAHWARIPPAGDPASKTDKVR